MKKCDRLKKWDLSIREDWFRDHEILEHDLLGYSRGKSPIETLTWGKVGTNNYRIFYVLRQNHGTLMVYGDLGEAIYRWYSPVSLRAIAGFDLHYFHGKTDASELGRSTDNYEWDENIARKAIFEHFKDHRDCKGYKKFQESYVNDTLHNKQEFIAELYQVDHEEMFGSDAWEWIYGVGDVIPIRCQSHLIGIKMAVDILNDR